MITRCIQIFDALLQFPQVMSFLNHLDKEQTQIKYYTKIKFYGLFKKCNDDELRVMLFSKLNNRILKGK